MKVNLTLTRRAKIIWGILGIALILLPLLGWLNSPAAPAVSVQNSSPKPSLPKKADVAASGDKAPLETAQPITIPALPARNVGELSDLRGELEVLKIQSQIDELKAKRDALKQNAATPSSPAPAQLFLPALTPPPAASSRALSLPAPRSGLAVVSVQGVGNAISATLRTGSGEVVVRPGSKVGDAVVTSISREGVSVRRAGKISNLPFE